ncbi:MAG: L-carnitine dehydratase/bile acid-inducible protein [Streptosporangiaceae bacterium]|nr:L-carnitine dehydratase/bile acid-inducible protein [Streptosporangiaceae bacterium]
MTGELWTELLSQALTALPGDTGAGAVQGELSLDGAVGLLGSNLPAHDTAIACVGTALLAAAALAGQRDGRGHRPVRVDAGHVAAAVRSEVHLRLNGQAIAGFAPLSRFWRASDGWVRTHGNYSWHREALLRGLETTGDIASVEAAVKSTTALEVEERVVAAGGLAVAVRTEEEWLIHPHGQVVAGQCLVEGGRTGNAAPRRRVPGLLPASGLRVLDLTRVIAGPVSTRFLAALGADVLRLDPPHRPELPLHVYDGLPGKRSAVLDARTPDGLARLHGLLDGADVLVHGYRPGALDCFGLSSSALADRHPGLVVVSLSAWGASGPWGGRRGFDSIVQAATGIAMVESPDGDRPGALPCQLLDHGTGYLAAAAVLDALRRQEEHGGTYLQELSLARTAHWLLGLPRDRREPLTSEKAHEAWLTTVGSADGPITTVTPPGVLDGRRLCWPSPLTTYGGDRLEWPSAFTQ